MRCARVWHPSFTPCVEEYSESVEEHHLGTSTTARSGSRENTILVRRKSSTVETRLSALSSFRSMVRSFNDVHRPERLHRQRQTVRLFACGSEEGAGLSPLKANNTSVGVLCYPSSYEGKAGCCDGDDDDDDAGNYRSNRSS